MDAYPEAKIILTTRDESKWFESMKLTIWHAKQPSPIMGLIRKHVWGGDTDTIGKESGTELFRKHNEGVRAAAKERGREVLEYEVKEVRCDCLVFLTDGTNLY